MSAAFFPAAPFAATLLAVVCYLGVVLSVTGIAVRGPSRSVPEIFVTVVYAAMFPLPSSLAVAYLIQFSAFVIAMATLGPVELRHSILRRRELRAHRAGRTADPMSRAAALAVFAPAAALAAYLVIGATSGLFSSVSPWTATLNATEAHGVVELGAWKVLSVVGMFSIYMAAAWFLDREWVRLVSRIRLLTVELRFAWINIVVAAVTALSMLVILASGVGSATAGRALLFAAAVGLLPVVNGVAWIYDAVFRRVLSFHLLVAASALIVAAVKAVEEPLNLSPLATWAVLLGAVGVAALALSPLIDQALERWLFPRAGQMRGRLLAIAGSPPSARTRAEAAAGILGKVAEVLDAEGAAIVVHPTPSEGAAVERIGSVETLALGSTPAEVARYVGGLVSQARPRLIENLPLADQLRLLDSGVSLICPLVARGCEATLLLAPRRGWPYDDATIRALGILGRQLGLALENLTMANARAHGEKLEALGGAAARIAHEIRNPLAGARSLVQLLGRADADGLAVSAVEELDRIGRLVGELLAFARRDDVGVREPIDLAAACVEAARETADLAGDAAVEVRLDLQAAIVRGDHRRLVQVFANLLRNGIEALGDAAPPRRLSVRCGAADGRAVVQVCDNGPGISAEDRAGLFEPFRTTKSSGTGLGLPIARGIVESHGGCILVESAPGSGTAFRVELPLTQAAEMCPPSGERPPPASILRKVG